MARYRKKPVEVEARQFGGIEHFDEMRAWVGPDLVVEPFSREVHVWTLEGALRVSPGDWIIQGVKGEFYPCRADIFEATYEPAPSPAAEEETRKGGRDGQL
jgi:hypothetical protein